MRTFRIFKPTEEQINTYKPYCEDSYATDIYYQRSQEIDILVYCMSSVSKKTPIIIDDLLSKIKLYEFAVRNSARYNVYSLYKNSDDGTLELYNNTDSLSKEEIIDTTYNIVEDLILFIKAVKCDDYFAYDSNFFKIKTEIKEKIEYIREIFYDDEINQIIDSFKDCEIQENNG